LNALTEPIDTETYFDAVLPALSYGVYKAISTDTVDGSNNGHCSTSLCQFANFDTLAVCSSCEQHVLSGEINDRFPPCYWKNESEFAVDGIVFGQPVAEGENSTMTIMLQEIEKRRSQESFHVSITCSSEPQLTIDILNEISAMLVRVYPFGQSGSRPMARVMIPNDPLLSDSFGLSYDFGSADHGASVQRLQKRPIVGEIAVELPDPESVASKPVQNGLFDTCHYNFQAGSYHYTLTNEPDPSMIMNSTCMRFTTDLRLWFRGYALSDQFGTLNGTITKCSLHPCVQRIAGARLQDNQYTVQDIHPITRWYSNSGSYEKLEKPRFSYPTDTLFCSGDDDKCLYSWTPKNLALLGSWFLSVIDTTNFYSMYMTQKDGPGSNYTLFYERVAAQLSAVLQSRANPFIANVTGIAYGTEIYVQVNWLWFILPLVLLASCLIILILSIWDSSRKEYLFKNNILAAIAFELHGWEPHEYGVDETWTRHSMRNVEKKAERMVARMQLPHEGDGGLRLKRE
jgi:hypothetical protein